MKTGAIWFQGSDLSTKKEELPPVWELNIVGIGKKELVTDIPCTRQKMFPAQHDDDDDDGK
eukprot:m.230063 g.230063  ORF g.230063 m.230063 type:complete len:61 (+) comp15995_c0_seq1:1328-1510(+)